MELSSGRAFDSSEAARLAVFDYIEAFYNRARMHSSLDYQSPAQDEERLNRLGMCPRSTVRRTGITPNRSFWSRQIDLAPRPSLSKSSTILDNRKPRPSAN
ncbi:IS3 family transposase [Luteimonas sp. SDU101]|uniref:IS3 family transposase n=1 Tax=Luteimonas sp. SDU101 TaxID=3422593 RepID=UPI003EB92C48